MEGSFTTQNISITHCLKEACQVAANVTPSSKMRIRNMKLNVPWTWVLKKGVCFVLFCFFKEKVGRSKRRWNRHVSFRDKPAFRPCPLLPSPFPFVFATGLIFTAGKRIWDLPFPERPRVMFLCKPNILTGSEVEDRHNRRMNVQVYSPKEEQALPPNYEQLLNRTEHQQRQKMYVCGWKKCWRLI